MKLVSIWAFLFGLACACELHAQTPDSIVYYAWYDPVQNRGYGRLAPDSLGPQSFKATYSTGKPVMVQLFIQNQDVARKWFGGPANEKVTADYFSDHYLQYRNYTCVQGDTTRTLKFRKSYRKSKSPWRCTHWVLGTPDQITTLYIEDATPYRFIRNIRADSASLDFSMPDTTRLMFRLRKEHFHYDGSEVYWHVEEWMVDRRAPQNPLRWLTKQTVFQYHLPTTDPAAIIGRWGLYDYRKIGTVVAEYSLPMPYPGMHAK